MRRLPLVLLIALAAWGSAGVSAARAPGLRFAPLPHHDAADVPASPLDLRTVTFGQQDAQLLLHLRTAGPWSAGQLGVGGDALCVTIRPARATADQTRICVVGDAGRPALHVSRIDATGEVVSDRELPAIVSRPDRRTIDAFISRRAAGLPLGRFSWSAASRWVDPRAGTATACGATAPCADVFPDAGAVPDRLRLLAEPRCFGAAARDPRHRCRNPALRTAVVPTPADALITPNAYCKLTQRHDLVSICEFGVPASSASGVVALVGDSHAQHWRGALEVAAQARGWHGISITRPSCPLIRARVVSPRTALARRQCRRWNAEVVRWFRHHPEVHTLFVSDHATVRLRGDAVRGYREAWRRLPPSVDRIVVLRDTPGASRQQAGCVTRELRAGRPAGVACAEPRSRDLPADPQVEAARGAGSRVRVIDLTQAFCDASRCFAVVGGALVHKDTNHMTRVFATTLGPYLLRAYDALTRR